MSDPAEAAARGADFVRRGGDGWARLRLDALRGDAPPGAVREVLGARLRPDGSLAPREGPGPRPALAEVLEALAALDDLRIGMDGELEALLGWLAAQQRGDGGWDPDDGCESRALVLTGLVAGYLAKTPFAPASVLSAAGDFLDRRWSADRVGGGAYGPLVAFAHFFANAPHERADAALQWCGRELERGYRKGDFDALRTLRALCLCDAPSLPGGRLKAADLVTPLLALQAPDGGWRPGAPPALRVEETLAALAALGRTAAPGPP